MATISIYYATIFKVVAHRDDRVEYNILYHLASTKNSIINCSRICTVYGTFSNNAFVCMSIDIVCRSISDDFFY